jgi:hypothetical protein
MQKMRKDKSIGSLVGQHGTCLASSQNDGQDKSQQLGSCRRCRAIATAPGWDEMLLWPSR